MKKSLKQIAIGFLASFIGSIPLGYLNVIGFEIFDAAGLRSLLYYLTGIVLIEVVVVYVTLRFAEALSRKEKLIKSIALFSIFFMVILAFVFFFYGNADEHQQRETAQYLAYSPFISGLTLSALNFVQVPFWLGWNLYFISSKIISTGKSENIAFVSGAAVGTFSGMLVFIIGLDFAADNTGWLKNYLLPYLVPVVFLLLALAQALKFYHKYYANQTQN